MPRPLGSRPLSATATEAPGRLRLGAWAARHRFATLAVALVALALVLRLGWGWFAGRRLAAALEEVRRRGEPMALADFVEDDLPPSQNAWMDYAAAAQVVAASGARSPR